MRCGCPLPGALAARACCGVEFGGLGSMKDRGQVVSGKLGGWVALGGPWADFDRIMALWSVARGAIFTRVFV